MSKKPLTAISIVEVLVAGALISVIGTGIARALLYAQRSVINARLRAKALNQAQSCLDKFRNLRDSTKWSDFCARLTGDYNTASGARFNTLTYTIHYTDSSGHPRSFPTPVCNADTFTDNGDTGAQYSGVYQVDHDGCNTSTDPESAVVKVHVFYNDFSHAEKEVVLSQQFQRDPNTEDSARPH
ncbi:hypothetical protein IJJ12_01550 [bacterium]|nr:hypothetical protein [bacterium]